jgi:hypothetical protein
MVVSEIPAVVRILLHHLMQTCNVFTRKRQVFVILDLNGKEPLVALRAVLIYLFSCEQSTSTWYVLLFNTGIGIMTRCVSRCSKHPRVSTAY